MFNLALPFMCQGIGACGNFTNGKTMSSYAIFYLFCQEKVSLPDRQCFGVNMFNWLSQVKTSNFFKRLDSDHMFMQLLKFSSLKLQTMYVFDKN